MDEPFICGRCGYELTGVIDSWELECPLEGVCSECGSAFRWRDIFHIDRLNKRWLVEHASTKAGLIKRIPLTVGMAVLPWFFWFRLSMQAKIDLRKAATASLLLVMALHLAVGGYITASEVRQQYANQAWYFYNTGAKMAPLGWSSVPAVWAKVVLGEFVVIELEPAVMPIGAGGSDGSPTTNRAVQRLSAYPVARHSALGLTVSPQIEPPIGVFGMAISACWLALMGLLPTTRRLANLRWAHPARAFVYGLAGSAVLGEAFRVMIYVTMRTGSDAWMIAGVLATIAWPLVWWSSAVVFGWRLPHRWWVALLISVAAFLGAIVATILFWLIVGPLVRML